MDRLILPTRINPFWAERFTILGRVEGVHYKLFQVLFTDKRGSVYVNFPYFRDSRGIAAVASLPADGTSGGDISLPQQGRLTSHLVKYHHPPDGRVHFSQDGKVRNELGKQSIPLADLDGHMFTIYLNGMTTFSRLEANIQTLSTTKKGGVVLDFQEGDPGWIKVVGFWHRRQRAASIYAPFARDGVVGPIVDSPEVRRTFLAPWYKGDGGTHVLAITAQTLPAFDRDNGPMMVFIGGFDTEAKINDPFQPTTMLAFKYPATDFEELRTFMGSIDYVPESPVES